MKHSPLLIVVIAGHVLGVVFLIYKQSLFIQASYQTQKYEQEREVLLTEKELLTHKLYALKDRSAIRQYVMKELHMKSANVATIKKIEDYENTEQL